MSTSSLFYAFDLHVCLQLLFAYWTFDYLDYNIGCNKDYCRIMRCVKLLQSSLYYLFYIFILCSNIYAFIWSNCAKTNIYDFRGVSAE
jgi:hypothetical protein